MTRLTYSEAMHRRPYIPNKTTVTTALLAGTALAFGGASAATAGPHASAAAKPVKKTIKVGDDYFSPKKLSLPVNSTVTYKWLSGNSETHDVKLKKGPRGFKRFHSDSAATDFSYRKKLTKKGTYSILCTFHEGMTQTITVK